MTPGACMNCQREVADLRSQVVALREALEKLAGFLPGNGDVAEVAAMVVRATLAAHPEKA